MYTEASKKATLKYMKKLKRVSLDFNQDDYSALKRHCDSIGKPVGTFIKELIKKELINPQE